VLVRFRRLVGIAGICLFNRAARRRFAAPRNDEPKIVIAERRIKGQEINANICIENTPAEKPMGESEAADLAKVSRPTMHDAVQVAEKGEPELKDAVRRGQQEHRFGP